MDMRAPTARPQPDHAVSWTEPLLAPARNPIETGEPEHGILTATGDRPAAVGPDGDRMDPQSAEVPHRA